MNASRGTVVVWGMLARQPVAGLTWQVLHHLVGLRRLGFDVWYVEDSDTQVFDPVTWWPTLDADANIEYARRQLERFGFGERCVLRAPTIDEPAVGGSRSELGSLYRRADAVINLCGAQEPLDSHADIGCLVYLETDPVQSQVLVAGGDTKLIDALDRYDHLFTYGMNLGAPDCPVPLVRYTWHRTRPPVVLDWWEDGEPPARRACTTILNFRHVEKDVSWRGDVWRWSKHEQFGALETVPRRAPVELELAAGAIGEDERAALVADGWRVRDGIADPEEYRGYIRSSLAEFTVAKQQYVDSRCGWFSDRSASYLAAGRPVVTQDTGPTGPIVPGEGLLTYAGPDEAVAAVEELARDYDRHARAARELARDCLAAEDVLGDVMTTVGLL